MNTAPIVQQDQAHALRILIAPDKFKGCLSALNVAEALRAGIDSTETDTPVTVSVLPLADGGDGSVEAAVLAGSRSVPVEVRDADGQPRLARIAFDGITAVVEVASTCGLSTLRGPLRPLTSSSRGLGEAILAAVKLGPKRLVVALGGSASTDGGAGMLAALGAQFRDEQGRPVDPSGGELSRIAGVDLGQLVDLTGIELIGASDVTNPLRGANGAAAVFGPQKGADDGAVASLERGLDSWVEVCGNLRAIDAPALGDMAGAGSAGGIGFGLLLLGGSLVSGADYFLDLLQFSSHIDECDLLITGEGRLDAQTAGGKLISTVCRRAGSIPVWAVAGCSTLAASEARQLGLSKVLTLQELSPQDTSRDPALATAVLQEAGRAIVKDLNQSLFRRMLPVNVAYAAKA
ncbi:glycerate kinase [Arthrobacter sp. R4-81]